MMIIAIIVLIHIEEQKVDRNIVMDTIQRSYESQSDGPKYRAVANAIRQSISDGALAIDEKLPPVRDLAWRLQITPGTVARAYTLLVEEGALYAEVGRGTFVAKPTRVAALRDVHRDRQFQRHVDPIETGTVSMFAPKLPNLGQAGLIHDSFARMSQRPEAELLSYPGRSLSLGAQKASLRWLSGVELGPVNEQDLILSHGSQNGIVLILQAVLKGANPVILVEELSYPGFRRAAQLMRAEVVAVPMDDHGVIPAELNRLARKHNAQVFCTCPEVHNPTNLVTPASRRREIAEVAKATGLHIIQDESYQLRQPSAPSYRALVPETGWYVTSISKSLTPALRVGFVFAPKPNRSAVRQAAEHGFFGLATPLTFVIEDILSRPETQVMADEIRATLRNYIHAAVNVLGGYKISWHPEVPYIWLCLPEGWRASAFAQAAEAHGAQVRTAEDFVPRNGFAPHAVRLSINAEVSLASYESALARLRELLDHPPEAIMV